MTDAPVYDKVALIGLGLIASSMFWATRRAGLARHVTGFARSDGDARRPPAGSGFATPWPTAPPRR